MKDTSTVTMSTSDGRSAGSSVRAFDALDDHDPRVVTEAPVELTVADVESNHTGRAASEQHVGESARRCADVERLPSVDRDAESVDRVRELDAAASDIRMVGLLQ